MLTLMRFFVTVVNMGAEMVRIKLDGNLFVDELVLSDEYKFLEHVVPQRCSEQVHCLLASEGKQD
jgi:hypothetical protein